MDQIGVFTPEQARELWQFYQSQKQLPAQLTKSFPQRRPIDEVSPHRVFVKNTESETIPPFACMRIIGAELVGGRTALRVEKPTLTSGEFVFNGPYEIKPAAGEDLGVGWAFRYGIVVMLGDPPSEPNVSYQPVVGSWEIEEGGASFTIFGEYKITPDSTTAAVIGRFTNGEIELSHGIVLEVCNVGCSTYRVQRVHRYLTPNCDDESGSAS